MGAACSRRRRPAEDETPFWEEEVPLSKEGAKEEEKSDPLGYEQAAHLKDDGKEKFARGAVAEAMDCWGHALEALYMPPRRPHAGVDAEPPPPDMADDPRSQELRVTLLLNLALGHKKLKQWRHAVSYCDEVLLEQPDNVKALFRKADALGELCTWQEAEEATARLEETGEEGRKLAAQKRDEWRRRRKAADGRQKKMWSAALESSAKDTVEEAQEAKQQKQQQPQEAKEVIEKWTVPKVTQMSVFDLRRKGISWQEAEDFDDTVWRDGLGHREATYYQRHALPLTLVAAAALAELDFKSELVVHCILDGNTAPFAQPHDWSTVLQRCPGVRSLTVVYIDIGFVGNEPGSAPPMPYGTLLRPTEEGRIGDRVARSARFLGTYKEFQEHCRDLPGLVDPQVALWADVPLYGFGEDDFAVRLEAYHLLATAGVPSVVTQGGEVPHRSGPPMPLRVDDYASLSMAVLSAGVGAQIMANWVWNRFIVPLDRTGHGILAAHALLAVVRPPKAKSAGKPPAAEAVKQALKKRGLTLTPYKMPDINPCEDESQKLRQQQWQAFCIKMREAGRPVGPAADEQESRRQSMEFYQFCGLGDPVPQ